MPIEGALGTVIPLALCRGVYRSRDVIKTNGSRGIGITGQTDNLRALLRDATASAHDTLDHAMRSASGWTSLSDYTRFLELQHAARQPVESWLAHKADETLRPPAQCHLIAQDLSDLSRDVPEPAGGFDRVVGASDKAAILGVAWVLAGSSLGNRAILKDVHRISSTQDIHWPHAFLADPAMLAYWKRLRPRIERPSSVEEVENASRAANAVFDHFLAATSMEPVGA